MSGEVRSARYSIEEGLVWRPLERGKETDLIVYEATTIPSTIAFTHS